MPEVRGSRGTAPETIPPSFISRLRSLLRSSQLLSPAIRLSSVSLFLSALHPCLVRELPARRKIPLSSPSSYLLLRCLHSHPVERDSWINLRALDNIRSVLRLRLILRTKLSSSMVYVFINRSYFSSKAADIFKNLSPCLIFFILE